MTCPSCQRQLRGYVPKGGDGSAFKLPKHKDKPRGGKHCRGSYDLV